MILTAEQLQALADSLRNSDEIREAALAHDVAALLEFYNGASDAWLWVTAVTQEATAVLDKQTAELKQQKVLVEQIITLDMKDADVRDALDAALVEAPQTKKDLRPLLIRSATEFERLFIPPWASASVSYPYAPTVEGFIDEKNIEQAFNA